MNTIPIDLKRRPIEDVPAATIALWAKECGLELTATQIGMLALQWRVSILVAVAENEIAVAIHALASQTEEK